MKVGDKVKIRQTVTGPMWVRDKIGTVTAIPGVDWDCTVSIYDEENKEAHEYGFNWGELDECQN